MKWTPVWAIVIVCGLCLEVTSKCVIWYLLYCIYVCWFEYYYLPAKDLKDKLKMTKKRVQLYNGGKAVGSWKTDEVIWLYNYNACKFVTGWGETVVISGTIVVDDAE